MHVKTHFAEFFQFFYITAEMRPYENPWPYNVKTVFNKYLGNGRSN